MDQDQLLSEFMTTASDSLLKGIQRTLGVEDGGFAGLTWPDSPAVRATIEAIKVKAPSFKVGRTRPSR